MRILVAGWTGSTNVGDELIFEALAAKLVARGADITAVSTSPGATRDEHDVDAVGHLSPAALWRAVGEADGVILGGGSLVQDVTSPFNVPLHLSRTWMALARGVPFAGVGLGAGPLASRLGKALAARSLRSAVAIAVRDPESAALLEALGLPRPVVAADLAFSLPEPEVEPEDRLVACLRPWAGAPRVLPVAVRRHDEETPEWFVAAAATALDDAAKRTGLAVHLVAFQADRDGPLHERIADRMTAPVTTAAPGRRAILGEVARSRAVVAMRYHGAVAAALAGRPVVTVDYAPKVPSLAAELGVGAASVGWSHEGLARLAPAILAVLPHDATVRAGRARLRDREGGNDLVIDRLMEKMAVKRTE
jgi:polysaccharide pyruvyl transferase CsaB